MSIRNHFIIKAIEITITGWVHNNIQLPESVADHMYRMSMMSFMVSDNDINKDYLMKICMVHDLAESIVGDITPHQNISKEVKRQMEEVRAQFTV